MDERVGLARRHQALRLAFERTTRRECMRQQLVVDLFDRLGPGCGQAIHLQVLEAMGSPNGYIVGDPADSAAVSYARSAPWWR